MRDVSHKTWIAIVLDHVNAWRKANGWSRETFALGCTPIWVRPVAIALSVAQGGAA